MIRIWVLRHGDAERQTQRDAERALTGHGRECARRAGAWLAARVTPELQVLASPYVRARQTAEAALLAMPGKAIATAEWLIPDFDPRAALRELAGCGAREMLLVSHQPLVGALIGLLVSDDYRAGPPMDTATLAELSLGLIAPGYATLESLRHAPDYDSGG